jgi:hypothetical protein
MKLTLGEILTIAIALGFAAVLVFYAPFESAAADAGPTQVVYASLLDPPVIGNAAGKVDFPLLFLELAFVLFVGGAIFIAASQKQKD